jgi:hypothetical protein
MSIFRESFPNFIQEELTRRQAGMASRSPAFLHQLNSRSAWVRMTSGVNYNGSSDLAKKYVMQGGILNGDNLRSGLGGTGTSSYDLLSPGGKTNRLGIRPMPGITNVSIQSKGAYGSLQEATVTFTAWDIKQLEELEVLYMRPGYTVLLEFGWDYAKADGVFPKYDILDKTNITLNAAFAEIYQKIASSGGNYDALLGYVKNYNWTARDDGGYDCTTSIISLGEVLESLKCNWVPMETQAFDNSEKGLLKITNTPQTSDLNVLESYEKGIIPGLIQELWNYMHGKPNQQASVITDNRTKNFYYLYKQNVGTGKNDRNGLPKHLGAETKEEIFITLGSFCDLLSSYVLLKGENNQPLSEIVTYETTYDSPNYIVYQKENTTNSKKSFFNPAKPTNAFAKTLKCIASPLSLSTNLGVCYVKNDNWNSLQVSTPSDSTPTPNTPAPATDINNTISRGLLYAKDRFIPKFKEAGTDALELTDNPGQILGEALRNRTYYRYNGNLEQDIQQLTSELKSAIKSITYVNGNPYITFSNNVSFAATSSKTSTGGFKINFFDLFYPDATQPAFSTYVELLKTTSGDFGNIDFFADSEEAKHNLKDNTGASFTKDQVLKLINKYFTQIPLDARLQQILNAQTAQVAQQVAQAAAGVSPQDTLPFLAPSNDNSKQLGYISNIYVNLNFLYDQAISKNNASNDTQNKNNISIRDYLQSILREVQNSLGNVNNFDIQVDNRNAIGRIIDINFTGGPENNKSPFLLQIHNLNSVVRNYKFSSKIFPEMGSIIAISAQDASGIGKLGYDNATLVAWNEGIRDRLIPKKNFNNDIMLNDANNPNNPATFILPFLTKMYAYFQAIKGNDQDNINFAYGGLDFSFRDFLSNLDRFDPRNTFKTIIPTELSITLDGLGGIIIGNLFKINQDIVPRGYRSTGGRDMAYIVTKLGHKISDNDWTTELTAFPVVFENAPAVNVKSKWKNQQYPGTKIKIGGQVFNLGGASVTNFNNQSDINSAVKFFTDKGYSKAAAAALVGSFLQESALKPSIVNYNPQLAFNASEQTYAAGIAQWVGPRRVELLKYAKSKGITISNYDNAVKIENNKTKTTNSREVIKSAFSNINLQTQLEFVNKETAKYPGFNSFKTSTDLSEAVLWVYEIYEGGNYSAGAALGNREIYAFELYNK